MVWCNIYWPLFQVHAIYCKAIFSIHFLIKKLMYKYGEFTLFRAIFARPSKNYIRQTFGWDCKNMEVLFWTQDKKAILYSFWVGLKLDLPKDNCVVSKNTNSVTSKLVLKNEEKASKMSRRNNFMMFRHLPICRFWIASQPLCFNLEAASLLS